MFSLSLSLKSIKNVCFLKREVMRRREAKRDQQVINGNHCIPYHLHWKPLTLQLASFIFYCVYMRALSIFGQKCLKRPFWKKKEVRKDIIHKTALDGNFFIGMDNIYTCVCVCVSIYIYIERERERDSHTHRSTYLYVYTNYVYIYSSVSTRYHPHKSFFMFIKISGQIKILINVLF